MKTKAEHSIIADAIHEWHTVYLPCIRNLSHNALKSYGEGMGIYIDFLESSKGVTSNTICGECFRKDWIEEWIAWLKEVRKCSPQTCNHRLSILKNFLRFLAHKKIQFIKYDCDAAEIKRMQQTLIGKRDFALFNLLYSTGTRIDEILSLRLSALHLDETKSYILVLGKGNKQRTIYLLNSMVKILKHYVKLFHPANPLPSDFVFFPIYGHANKKITSEAISKRLKMYVRIASQGLLEIPADFHCHSFRHARATHWLEDGVNLAQIQKLLGHESIETTMKYVGVSSEQMVQALCSMEDNLTLGVEKKYKKIRNKDSLATVLGLR